MANIRAELVLRYIPSLSTAPGTQIGNRSKAAAVIASQRFQVFDEIGFLLRAKAKTPKTVVVLHHGHQIGEASVVIEPTLAPREKSLQRRRAIAPVGRAGRLEIIDPDLARRVIGQPGSLKSGGTCFHRLRRGVAPGR
jgi:hypothetical protein